MASDPEIDSRRILRLFLEPESSICEKTDRELVLFLAVTGVCMVFTNVRHCFSTK